MDSAVASRKLPKSIAANALKSQDVDVSKRISTATNRNNNKHNDNSMETKLRQ